MLLHYVRQFVGEQSSPTAIARRILVRTKGHVVADGVGRRIHRPRRLSRPRVGMDAHAAEVMAEARLHEPARRHVQRPAGGAQHLVDNGRGHSRATAHSATLQAQPLLAALGAFAAVAGMLAAGAGALQHSSHCRLRLGWHLLVYKRLLLSHVTSLSELDCCAHIRSRFAFACARIRDLHFCKTDNTVIIQLFDVRPLNVDTAMRADINWPGMKGFSLVIKDCKAHIGDQIL
jgi:hypothetical protein